MNIRIIATLLTPFLLLMLMSSASAQAQRTFVSGVGSDSNPCSRTAPCRNISHALMGTSAGGEVVVLDSAGYGTFTITQAVSITAPPGVHAGISVFSGDGILVNAGASDTIVLRGLTITNQGSLAGGINLLTGGTLHIEGCVVNGFSNASTGNGILVQAGARLELKDSIIRGNNIGVVVEPVTGSAPVTIDGVRLEGNLTYGIWAEPNSTVTVRNSIASGNGNGFFARSDTSAPTEMNIENCVASNNAGAGILVMSTSTGVATVRVSNSTVTDNGIGLDNAGVPAVLLSRSNNTVEGNNTDTMGTIGSYSAK